MVSVDPENKRVYVMDAGAGMVAGVDLKDGDLSVAWSHDQTTPSFTTLIGPEDQRVLIGTDIPIKKFQDLRSYLTEAVVWRDAATVTELARSSEFPKMTQGILVTPGYARLQYFLTVIALQVTPAGWISGLICARSASLRGSSIHCAVVGNNATCR
jgi:hypothetical protein